VSRAEVEVDVIIVSRQHEMSRTVLPEKPSKRKEIVGGGFLNSTEGAPG
jgi:hypothetical protein